METIGDRVKYIRKKILNNKSQKEFGNLIGLRPNSISCIETGTSNLTEQTANAICREFNINKEWLLTGEGNPENIPEDETAAVVSDLLEEDNPFYDLIIRIMKTYKKLDDKSQTALKNMSQELLNNLKKGD